jgi:hypothetical protein
MARNQIRRERIVQLRSIAIMDIGGSLWLIIDVVFVCLLAAAMIYGLYHWRQRRKTKITEEIEKQAVDRAYRD